MQIKIDLQSNQIVSVSQSDAPLEFNRRAIKSRHRNEECILMIIGAGFQGGPNIWMFIVLSRITVKN